MEKANFAQELEYCAREAFARIPGEISWHRIIGQDESELRFESAAFDYVAAIRVTDKRLLAEDPNIREDIKALADQTVECLVGGFAPLRPGYPKPQHKI